MRQANQLTFKQIRIEESSKDDRRPLNQKQQWEVKTTSKKAKQIPKIGTPTVSQKLELNSTKKTKNNIAEREYRPTPTNHKSSTISRSGSTEKISSNLLNKTFPRPKSAASSKSNEKQKQLVSSLKKSYEKSSDKKAVKFVDQSYENSPEKKKTTSKQQTPEKIFMVNRSQGSTSNYKTSGFYHESDIKKQVVVDQMDPTQTNQYSVKKTSPDKRRLEKSASDPKLRIIAPGFEVDSPRSPERRYTEFGRSKPKMTPKVVGTEILIEDQIKDFGFCKTNQITQLIPSHMRNERQQNTERRAESIEDQDSITEHKKTQTNDSVMSKCILEESTGLIKSLHDYNRSVRQQ